MIYIGIDPEPSGAFCIWYEDLNALYFSTSNEDIQKRSKIFQLAIHPMGFENQLLDDITVFIEDAWGRPNQDVKSTTKYMKSFGAWLGILYTIGFKNVHIIPASVWKKELELSEDKIASYRFALQLIKDPETGISNQQKALSQIANSPTEKQMFDRCEAFLIAYYGRYFYDRENKEK